MADHHDESLLDKVKNAFGMGDDHEDAAGHEAHAATVTDEAADSEALDGGRPDGWAGVPASLYDDTAASGDDPVVAGGEVIVGGDSEAGAGYATADEPSGLGRNPGPVGSAQYEGGATPSDLGGTDLDPEGNPDFTREEVGATEFGGAYGTDDTPLPTSAAWDRGEAPPEGEASFGPDETPDPEREPDI